MVAYRVVFTYVRARPMQQLHVPRQSTIGTILAASDISGLTVLGELPESVVQWWALPERVTMVQATNDVMFHWSKHLDERDGLRADTATYQWVGRCCRTIVANPYALLRGDKPGKCQIIIIGKVEPPNSNPRYSTIEYLALPLKYVPSTAPDNKSGNPEIWLDTYIPHSQPKIKRYLKKAMIVGT